MAKHRGTVQSTRPDGHIFQDPVRWPSGGAWMAPAATLRLTYATEPNMHRACRHLAAGLISDAGSRRLNSFCATRPLPGPSKYGTAHTWAVPNTHPAGPFPRAGARWESLRCIICYRFIVEPVKSGTSKREKRVGTVTTQPGGDSTVGSVGGVGMAGFAGTGGDPWMGRHVRLGTSESCTSSAVPRQWCRYRV